MIVSCCINMYHNWMCKSLSTLNSPTMKWFLNVWIALSTLPPYDYLVELTGTLCPWLSFTCLKLCNTGLILRLLKSVYNYVKACIIYLPLLLFISVSSMELQ